MADKYDSMKLNQLQAEAKTRGISIKGRNTLQLVSRLRKADAEKGLPSSSAQPVKGKGTKAGGKTAPADSGEIILTHDWVTDTYDESLVRRVAQYLKVANTGRIGYVKKLIHTNITNAELDGREITVNLDELPDLVNFVPPAKTNEQSEITFMFPVGSDVTFETQGETFTGEVLSGPDLNGNYEVKTRRGIVLRPGDQLEFVMDDDTRPLGSIDSSESEPDPDKGEEDQEKKSWLDMTPGEALKKFLK